jgi:hypothetical protein
VVVVGAFADHLEQAKGLWAALKVLSFLSGIIVPTLGSPTKVTILIGGIGAVGGVFGWWWGKAELLPRDVRRLASRLVGWGLIFLAAYIVLLGVFPRLGLILPDMYEDPYFWGHTFAHALIWGVAVFMFVRLFTVLHRRATTNASSPPLG